MKKILILSLTGFISLNIFGQGDKQIKTFCNPLNLPYNFQSPGVTRREAADPVIVVYKDRYWLFASKQAGYWWSDDLLNWNFIKPNGLPLDVYAPAVTVINEQIYYTCGDKKGTFTTVDPVLGQWVNVNPYPRGCSDPAVLQDTDGKVYLFDGCSDKTPLRVTELDAHTFLPLTEQGSMFGGDPINHGWEVSGDINRGHIMNDLSAKSAAPWMEGSWVNKINGKYYWQYAAPGTQFKTYGDGVYISGKPTGPFVYQDYSPFSFKPTGFITGAGHSSTFAGKSGDYWHISTGVISVRHPFERRLMLFPTAVLEDGQLVTNTYLGDYPQYAPGTAEEHLTGNITKWMLLSFDKIATASSTLEPAGNQSFAIKNAFDEDIQTWWSAKTGGAGEWLMVDLKKICTVNAVQVNFADQGARQSGPLLNDGYQYYVEISRDGREWKTIVDHTGDRRDAPHDYTQLDNGFSGRFIRIKNMHTPANGLFSIYDLRVFGSVPGKSPKQVKDIVIRRNDTDKRRVHLKWKASPGADFYIVRYGIAPGRLFSNYQVYRATELNINALNVGVGYYFTVDAVSGSGITKGRVPSKSEVF